MEVVISFGGDDLTHQLYGRVTLTMVALPLGLHSDFLEVALLDAYFFLTPDMEAEGQEEEG